MKTQSIVILSVCASFCFLCLVVCGLVSSYLTSQLIAQKNAKVAVVIAKHNYSKGTAIIDPEAMFEIREILQLDAPACAVSDLKDLRDRTLTSDIREGQPVQNAFLESTKDASKSALIDDPEPGKRAIEIKTKGGGVYCAPKTGPSKAVS